ncbi:hypothetical protein ACP70R_030180 [Stipagrostis hirtigluma subsp. patula]
MAEIAEGLYSSNNPFLWVVRATEAQKLPENFADKVKVKGAYRTMVSAVGGSSTPIHWVLRDALQIELDGGGDRVGVPMVAMPHWSDQTTNTKYVQDVWRCDEERGCGDVCEGEMCKEFKKNALEWRNKAKKAMSAGGSSGVNISDFLRKFRLHKD